MSHMVKVVALSAAILGSAVAAAPAVAGPFLTPEQVKTATFSQLNGTQTLLFDGFDIAGAILQSVHITFTADTVLNNVARVVPFGAGNQSVGNPTALTASAFLSVTGSAGLSATANVSTPGFVGTVIDNNTTQVVGTVSQTLSGSSDLFSPPTNLSAYIGGTNAVSLLLSSFGTQGGSVPDEVLTGNNGSAFFTVKLQYDYDVVGTPEPASVAVLGLGMLALGAYRRRRNKA